MNKGKPIWWNDAVKFLKRDDVLGPLVTQYSGESLSGKGNVFESLIRSIVGQQISVKASQAIWIRLTKFVGGEITPENILKFSPEQLATCGLTKPKSKYIHGLASQSNKIVNCEWTKLSDEEVKKHLIGK